MPLVRTIRLAAMPLVALCLTGVSGCHGWYVTAPGSDVPSALSQQVGRAGEINQGTVDNGLLQARVAYGNLSGRLMTTGKLDLEAYRRTQTDLLPPLLAAANALAAGSDSASATELRQIYTDSLEQMLAGVNNNLQVYQGFFEAVRAGQATAPTVDPAYAQEAMAALGPIFQATALTLAFATQLGQFPAAVPQAYTDTVLEGVRRQQVTIIDGVINYAATGLGPTETRQAYQTIAQSLTNPALLNQLQRLAIAVFGADAVAYRQDQVTPAQPNPNLIVMVVRETPTTYRMISVENNKVVNQVVNDTRGLSASDMLQKTNVIRLSGGATAVASPSPSP